MNRFTRYREYWAGALMAAIGAGAIVEGQSDGFGSLSDIGSGFFPVLLGVGLVAMGGLMAATGRPGHENHAAAPLARRGTLAHVVAGGRVIGHGDITGLAPATFACVFGAALGSRTTTWREAALLALGVTVFGVLLFSLGLKVQFPIIRGVLP